MSININSLSSNRNNLESVKVAIRIRPFLKYENKDDMNMIFTDPDDTRKIKLIKNENCFEGFFDQIFPFHSSQENIFEFVKDSVDDTINGINCTIFTYGQTGSGKTFTMFGSDWTVNENYENNIYPSIKYSEKEDFLINDFVINPFSDDNGIVPRSLNQLFISLDNLNKNNNFWKNTIYCSFLQIYNERIYDLLEDNANSITQPKEFNTYVNNYNTNKLDQKSLNIREDKINGIYVDGLSEYIVENVYECLNLLKKGEKSRKKRHTKKNEMSSRSHTVFMLKVEEDKVNKNGKLRRAKLHLCDLAGSEKVDKELNPKSLHFNEMININLSLGTLGKVIHALSTKQNHIPYRDSKLTRLLQDSLGGNTRTYLIANISPNIDNYEETVSTLKFADRAKSVLTKVKPNEIIAYDENLVNKLTKEINELKAILAIRKKRGTINEIEDQFLKLKEENEKLKKYVVSNLTSDNIEKLMKENKVLKLELQKIKQADIISNNNNFTKNESILLFSKNNFDASNTYINYKNSIPNHEGSNKFVKAGYDVLSNKKNYNSYSGIFEVKELKNANERLKFLEQMEKKTNVKMKMELERLSNARKKKIEEKIIKNVERQRNIEKVEGHIKRLDYLYRNNKNVYSDYLIESTNKKLNSKNTYNYNSGTNKIKKY